MTQADALSRRPDYVPAEDNDNENVVMLPDGLFLNLVDLDLQQKIWDCKMLDSDATKAILTLLDPESNLLGKELEDWMMEKVDEDKILFYKGKQYVPQDDELCQKIVRSYHDKKTAGHPGELETYNSISQFYWWPGL